MYTKKKDKFWKVTNETAFTYAWNIYDGRKKYSLMIQNLPLNFSSPISQTWNWRKVELLKVTTKIIHDSALFSIKEQQNLYLIESSYPVELLRPLIELLDLPNKVWNEISKWTIGVWVCFLKKDKCYTLSLSLQKNQFFYFFSVTLFYQLKAIYFWQWRLNT